MAELKPIQELDPFSCFILPCPYNAQCQAQKVSMNRTAPGSCSRLPFAYQPFCRALPPSDPIQHYVAPNEYNPLAWPNSAATNPQEFASRRQQCSFTNAASYYNCLWKSK
jgi:hypothetical protein